MSKKKLIIGNFKQNPQSFKEAELLFKEAKKISGKLSKVEAVLCPPAPFLSGLMKYKGMLGAQDLSVNLDGAHTGEISGLALRDIGVKYVIVGHSERRYKGETNDIVALKLRTAFKAHLMPVLCVGEMTRDPKGIFWNDLKTQIKESLSGISKSQIKEIVIAYEPVWALSSTKGHHDVTGAEVHEAIIFIRKVLADMFGAKESQAVRIIYGGSANAKNAEEILEIGNADGLLPGKASLKAKEFGEMLKIASKI